MASHELTKQIEELVRARDTPHANLMIRKFLKSDPSDEATIKASEWYRRLGEYRRALKVLSPEKLIRAVRDTKTASGKKLLQMAYIFNFLGANEFVAELCRNLQGKTADDFRKLGQIASDQFDFATALIHFQRFQALDTEPGSYRSRLAQIAFADVLSGLEKFQEAYDQVGKVLTQTPEPLLKGICHQARGEYLANLERWEEALTEFSRAQSLFPEGETTLDSAFLWKWQGYVYAKRGNLKQARELFKKAELILTKNGLRIEAFLDLQRLRYKVGLVDESSWKQILFYPGLSSKWVHYLSDSATVTDWIFAASADVRIKIDFTNNEFSLEDQPKLEIPLELKCVGLLRICDRLGMDSNRLINILWHDEVFSVLQLQARLEALFRRIRRKYGFEIEISENHIWLSADSCKRIEVKVGRTQKPSFIQNRLQFKRLEFSRYYGLSSTQANEYLKRWKQAGWIQPTGKGPTAAYVIERNL